MASEREVILRCRSGDAEAFRWVVEQYGDILRRTAYLLVRDVSLAEDLAQESFLQAWRGMEHFRTETGLKPWLVRILLNRIASHRRRAQFPLIPLDALAECDEPTASTLGPEERAEMADSRREMRLALASLPMECQQALVLRYYADLSVAEIASALGCPEGTVKSRLHRGLKALREVLAETRVEWWGVWGAGWRRGLKL